MISLLKDTFEGPSTDKAEGNYSNTKLSFRKVCTEKVAKMPIFLHDFSIIVY